jgi:hypothetical protein
MVRTSAAIAAAEAKVAGVLSVQPAMASNAAPPGLGNRVENAPTRFPYPTSARKHTDLSVDTADTDERIADAITKIAGADEKMEIGRAKSACMAAKMESAGSTSTIADLKSACAPPT